MGEDAEDAEETKVHVFGALGPGRLFIKWFVRSHDGDCFLTRWPSKEDGDVGSNPIKVTLFSSSTEQHEKEVILFLTAWGHTSIVAFGPVKV